MCVFVKDGGGGGEGGVEGARRGKGDCGEGMNSNFRKFLCVSGISAPLYLNGIWRLNREYGSNIDTRKLDLEMKFIKNSEPNATSYVQIRVKAREALSYNIRKYITTGI